MKLYKHKEYNNWAWIVLGPSNFESDFYVQAIQLRHRDVLHWVSKKDKLKIFFAAFFGFDWFKTENTVYTISQRLLDEQYIQCKNNLDYLSL